MRICKMNVYHIRSEGIDESAFGFALPGLAPKCPHSLGYVCFVNLLLMLEDHVADAEHIGPFAYTDAVQGIYRN